LAQRADVENGLLADLTLALYRFRDAERKVHLYGETLVPKVEQSVKVAQQAFEAGKAGFMALIDAQRLLLEFTLGHEHALAERGKRLAQIEMLAGGEMRVQGGTQP